MAEEQKKDEKKTPKSPSPTTAQQQRQSAQQAGTSASAKISTTQLTITPDTQTLDQFFSGDLMTLVDQISFDGMDPKFIRKSALDMTRKDSRTLIRWLVMYVHWGSKFYQKDQRSKNTPEAQKSIAALKTAGIVEDKKDGKITLARLAAAHAPLLLCVRRMMVSKDMCPPSNIIVPGLPLEYHDLAFACYSEYPGLKDMMNDFLRQFAMVLHKDAVNKRRSILLPDNEVYETMDKFRLAAVASLDIDKINRVNLSQITINTMLVAYGYPAI